MKISVSSVLILLVCVSFAWGQDVVPGSAEEVKPLLPGMDVPDGEFKRLDGTSFRILDEASRSQLILIFYRGGW